jgi:NADPH:quinone reductase-like Zn-dependent oxidoreductase
MLIICCSHVALNPTDWKHYFYGIAENDCILGCDYSGIVEEVGSAVTESFKKGDRICGVAHGGNASNKNDGIFAEYAVVKGDLQMHLPSNLSFAQASTFPLGAITCGQGLFQKALNLNLPDKPASGDEYVLVYGGSTATGSLATQYAKLAGYKVITTCSPKHNEWMKSHDIAPFNYSDPDCGAQIRKFTSNKLKYAFDTISLEDSAKICAEALSSESGGRYGALLTVDFPRKDVENTTTLMYTIFDEDFKFLNMTLPRSTEDFEFAKSFFELTEKLLSSGKLKTHPEKVREGGLEGVLKGMDEMKNGGVSGEKWVYKID